MKKLFGIKLHHREFFKALPELVSEIFKGHINWYDFAMGIVCIALLKGLQILKQKKENDESLSPVVRKGNSLKKPDRESYSGSLGFSVIETRCFAN